MRCAVYARKSTEEQIASLDVQVDEATRYIESKGWSVAHGHIYRDSAISRAEFKRRPGLIALLNALASGEFDAVIMRDDSRLGGDMHRTGLVVQDIVESGKRLFCYFEGNEITLDGATDKIMMALRGFAAELEREKIAGRTREHLETKARKGFVTGGKCYGYDNERLADHVEHRINETQAAIVREIFQARADGDGYKKIAKRLNSRGVPSPSAGKRGTGSWSPTVILCMLRNERYLGLVKWGKATKTYRGGTKVRLQSAEEDRIRTERPELRIISPELWDQVQATMVTRAKTGNRGRPEARYLLSGIGRCSQCGGPMKVHSAKFGNEKTKLYLCARHHDRGDAVCLSDLRRPVANVDAAVVNWVMANVLNEEVIAATLLELRRRISSRTEAPNTEHDELEAEAKRLRGEIDRLVAALASGAESVTIATVIGQREKRLTEVRARMEMIAVAPSVLDLEVRRLEKEARSRLVDFQTLLAGNVTEGRKVLETVFGGPLRFTETLTADGRRFLVEGTAAVGSIVSTMTSVPKGIRTIVESPNWPQINAAVCA
jgi:site-specific DNA recombinase